MSHMFFDTAHLQIVLRVHNKKARAVRASIGDTQKLLMLRPVETTSDDRMTHVTGESTKFGRLDTPMAYLDLQLYG